MTIITLKCDERSSERLRLYLQDNGISGKDEFHTTLFYNEEFPLFDRSDIREILEFEISRIELRPPYLWDVFDPFCLVLKYHNSTITNLKRDLIERVKEQGEPINEEEWRILERHSKSRKNPVFNPYNLHMTVAKNYTGDIEDLPDFREPITFSELNWYHQEHL